MSDEKSSDLNGNGIFGLPAYSIVSPFLFFERAQYFVFPSDISEKNIVPF
jgi:hypothetical protein